jgi:hypothetical protein
MPGPRYDTFNAVQGLTIATFNMLLTISLCAQDAADPQQRRIVSNEHRFSVLRPQGWFVLPGKNRPSFYNFRDEAMLPQGELLPGGAEIVMLTNGDQREVRQNVLKIWM